MNEHDKDKPASEPAGVDVAPPDLERDFFRMTPREVHAALSSSAGPAKRWLIEEHLPSGSIQWSCYEHERMARDEAASFQNPTTVTALYAHPAPATAESAALRALYEWYDRDGSVGGASEVFEQHRAAVAPATEERKADDR